MSKSHAKVTVDHQFKSTDPEQVFDAWLDPTLIGQWMFGPRLREEEVLRISVDPRVEGSFSFLVLRDGQKLNHIGKYLEINRPHRLVFTWGIRQDPPASSEVSIDIVTWRAGSKLTLTHKLHPHWAAYAKRTEAGWTTMLGVLDEVLSSTSSD